MGHLTSHRDESVSSMTLEQTAEVRDELERIVASQQFRASRRCKRLLRHITEHALVGVAGVLKERSLGIDVSGRTPDYDTSEDPIVRATAAETRKKLAQYYQDNSHAHELRIELLAGSYVAEFHSAQDPPPARGGAGALAAA